MDKSDKLKFIGAIAVLVAALGLLVWSFIPKSADELKPVGDDNSAGNVGGKRLAPGAK